MRRPLHLAMGFVEILVAVVLGGFVLQLPGPDEVIEKVGRVEAVSRESGQQVAGLRQQLAIIRQREPRARQVAERMREQVRRSGQDLRAQKIDYEEATERLADALGKTADGINEAVEGLSSEWLDNLALSLALTADFLDKRVVPAAGTAGSRLEESSRELRADARRLSALWAQAPLDVQMARSAYQFLGQFNASLEVVSDRLDEERIHVVLLELKGMELSVLSAADSAERLGSMTNPLEVFSLKRDQQPKTLWPEGKQSAARLRDLARGIEEARRQLLAQADLVPAVRAWVDAGRASTADARRDLARVIQQRLSEDPKLRNTPLYVASMAEDVLAVGEELGRLLRQTNRLREVSKHLRQAGEGTIVAKRRFQEMRVGLVHFAGLLHRLEASLRQVRRENAFKSSLEQTLAALAAFVDALPVLTDSLESELEEQDRSIGRLQGSVDRLSETLPESGRAAARLVQMTRILMLLMGGLFILHGVYLILASVGPEEPPKRMKKEEGVDSSGGALREPRLEDATRAE